MNPKLEGFQQACTLVDKVMDRHLASIRRAMRGYPKGSRMCAGLESQMSALLSLSHDLKQAAGLARRAIRLEGEPTPHERMQLGRLEELAGEVSDD